MGYFFDPTAPSIPVPVDPRTIDITLTRVDRDGRERFRLDTPLGYHDGVLGLDIVVPGEGHVLDSDLTSTPSLFTWLVPTTGRHLPAALVHDGLVCDPADLTYEAARPVPRSQADRIFRDAMGVLGTGRARRWLIWTAVTVATAWSGALADDPALRTWRNRRTWQAVVAFTIVVIVALGVLATVDVFREPDILPWMRFGGFWGGIGLGAVFAVLVPCLLSLLWRGVRIAAVITGVALAFLLHVTAALVVLTLLFRLIDDPGGLWARVRTFLRRSGIRSPASQLWRIVRIFPVLRRLPSWRRPGYPVNTGRRGGRTGGKGGGLSYLPDREPDEESVRAHFSAAELGLASSTPAERRAVLWTALVARAFMESFTETGRLAALVGRSATPLFGPVWDDRRRPALGVVLVDLIGVIKRPRIIDVLEVGGERFPVAILPGTGTGGGTQHATRHRPRGGNAACLASLPGVGLGDLPGTGVVTAAHVIGGRRTPEDPPRVGEKIALDVMTSSRVSSLVFGRLLAYEPHLMDFAVIGVESDNARPLEVCPMLGGNMQVTILGRRRAQQVRITHLSAPLQNIVSATRGQVPRVQNLIFVDRPGRPGDSGSLVVDADGRAVGIYLGDFALENKEKWGRVVDIRQPLVTFGLELRAEAP